MDPLPVVGWRDFRRRLRWGLLYAKRRRVRRALFEAETELGWLAWEQVDFYDERLTAEVAKVQEYENAQASLLNTSAELSGRKNELSEGLNRHSTEHDQTQAQLAAERAPLADQLASAETAYRTKTGAVERFERALEEMGRQEKRLQARSHGLLNSNAPEIETRIAAREIGDELAQVAAERKMLQADKVEAAREVAALEPAIARLRRELQRIDSASADARSTFNAARATHDSEARLLDRERKKSSLHMAHLDKEKRKPYRIIGASLADDGIAPLNQPEILSAVWALREQEAALEGAVEELRAACAAVDSSILISFYLLMAAVIFVILLIGATALRHL